MANLGVNLTKGIIKYTKNGCRLLPKTTTGNTKSAIIETDFGKGLKKVIQEFGEDGKLKSLTITHHDNTGKEIKTLTKLYSRDKGHTEIRTFVRDGNKKIITNCTEKQKVITEIDGSKSLLRIKLDEHLGKGRRYEEQAYEYLTNANNQYLRKNLYTSATRLNNGQIINKTVSGNLKNLEEIAKDPYIHIRNYSDKDFAQSASYIAAEMQGVERGKFIDKSLKKCSGYYQDSKKLVAADSSKGYKYDMVDTLNHEYRHKYQHEQILKIFKSFLNIFKSNKNKILMTPTESKQAKSFLKANLTYVIPEISYKKYYNNLLEIDARKAGEAAKSIYENYSLRLAEAFEGSQFGEMFGIHEGAFTRILKRLNKIKTINVGIFDIAGRAAKV